MTSVQSVSVCSSVSLVPQVQVRVPITAIKTENDSIATEVSLVLSRHRHTQPRLVPPYPVPLTPGNHYSVLQL